MEGWNDGPPEADQKDNSHFNFIVNPAGGGAINPTLHHPLRAGGQNPLFSPRRRLYELYEPEANIPQFHYSNCERSELT
jgi:hypothetical protein